MKKITFLVVCMLSLAITAQSVKLEYNLRKGDKYLIQMDMKQNMAPIMTMDIGISMSMETTDVKANTIDAQYRVAGMVMDMTAQGENIKFDSSKDDSELTAEERKMKAEIAPVLKAIMYQTMNKNGEVQEFRMEPDVKGAGAMLNQNQFTSLQYPNEAVKVGSSWDHTQSMNGMNAKITYTVTEITSSKVYADISGAMDGMAEAKVTGKLIVDRASGMFTNMDMDISMNAMGVTMGMEVNVSTKKM
jgi:hypothetical protein